MMKIFLAIAPLLVMSAVHAQPAAKPALVSVAVTLDPAQYQMIVTALAELPAKQSFDTITMLLNAEHAAQEAAKKPPAKK